MGSIGIPSKILVGLFGKISRNGILSLEPLVAQKQKLRSDFYVMSASKNTDT